MPAEQKSKKTMPLPVPDIGVFMAANQRAIAALTRCGADTFRHTVDMNTQFLDFARKRVAEDESVAETLSACRSPQDAMEAVSEFYRHAFDQYADEMRVVSDGISTLAGDAMTLGEAEAKALLETGAKAT